MQGPLGGSATFLHPAGNSSAYPGEGLWRWMNITLRFR